ncbi:MAG: M4 family metallopeptidase [Hyphomicrobium sp.]|jgi:Zn-dependent metalloprotease
MLRRAPILTIAHATMLVGTLAIALASSAAAQLPPSKYDDLQKRLEKKFAPPQQGRSPAPATSGSSKKPEDFIYIEPPANDNGKVPQKGGPGVQKSSVSSGTSWYGSLYTFFASKAGGGTSTAQGLAPGGAFPEAVEAGVTRPVSPRLPFLRSSRAVAPAGTPAAEDAAQKVPVAKPNSYVIQLKPSASDTDIANLLHKYDLKITKMIAPLGVITVEVNTPPAVSQPRSAVPEVAGKPGAPADAKAQLQQILEPPLIKDLRSEGIVDGAFVNTTMGTKVLPRPEGAKIAVEGETFSWRWHPGDGRDGNWGLKALRMPSVWSILAQHRKANPDAKRPKIGIVDGGFLESPSVPFSSMIGVKPITYHAVGCGTHHGMHVAGIIGARQTDTPGIDGMIPDARMDAIAVEDRIVGDAGYVGVDEGWEVHALLFDDVLAKTLDYVYANLVQPDNLRVINISLGYNFVASKLLGDASPDEVPGLALHVLHQSNLIRLMASRVQDYVLFVVAAGNDSEGREVPIDARWASPFAWAGTQPSSAGDVPQNILVVEAIDRDGARASFSNTGGHVSAPGVDIMSTLATGRDAFGVCSGSSQAAPHVAALAAILFELDPEKKPADVARIIKASAAAPKAGSKAAPSADALESVIELSPVNMALAADLDNNGKVDDGDLRIFARQLALIDGAATTNAAFTEDLNGDGVTDDNECFWPRIDFNGSGFGAMAPRDMKPMSGSQRADLAIIQLAWTDKEKPFDVAVAEAGIGVRSPIYAAADLEPAAPAQCRHLIASGTTIAQAPVTSGGDGGKGEGLPIAATAPSVSDPAAVKAEVERAIEELRKTNPNLRVSIDPATGLPTSVIGLAPQAGAASLGAASGPAGLTEEETRRAVEAYFGQGGLSSLYPTKNKQAKPEYVGRRRDPDFPDRYIAEVEQRVGGVPVFGSSAKLTVERSLGVTKYKGTTSNVAIDDTSPRIAEGEAVAAARNRLTEVIRSSPDASRAFPLSPDPQKAEVKAPQLVVFDPALIGKGKGPTRLAWLVTIDSFRIFIDAKTGEAFYYYRDQPSGMIRRVYDLGQKTAFPGSVGIDEEARMRAEDVSPEALLAFRNAGLVRDFYFLVFGRDGYDDNDREGPLGGSVLEAYVAHGRTQNAYWCTSKSYDCPKGDVMVYGPGYAGAIDIVAHEMTHGVIAHEKKLLYLNEPGAVNESLADIFGALIEFDAKGEGGNWLIGEASPGFSIAKPLRSLADPHLRDDNGRPMFDRTARFSLSNRGQPDHYSELLTTLDEQCASTAYNDNGCVHFNSGILNKFAYLIAEGGTHRGVSVTGIGRYKLARIAYRTMTAALNQSSRLGEAANGFVESCYELASGKLAGLTDFDCEQVGSAQRAVGLDAPSS